MGNILILKPTAIAALAVSRGTGGGNLLTLDPKEAWVDGAVGTAALIDIDLGLARPVDTVFLGSIWSADEAASWTITGGTAGYADITIKAAGALRVPERAGRTLRQSHAFWHGPDVFVRYLRISVTQPAGKPVLAIGVAMVGLSFVPTFNHEWGSGRGVKDTGTVTRLPSGSAAVAEGARYATYKFSLGDLTDDETDVLYELALDRGETRKALVVEDPDQTAGLRHRIHYGLLTGIRAFERRNSRQTRWEFQIEALTSEGDVVTDNEPTPALTLDGEPLSFGGEILTIGA